MKNTKIQWHPGFVSAMGLEFRYDREFLEFQKEYNLNTKPLEIDLLVIKKNADAENSNEIGSIFRGHNIMEYKSSDDRLSSPFKGIYYVSGNVLFPTQVIVTKEIDGEAHTWLKSLSANVEEETAFRLLRQIKNLSGQRERELADTVFGVMLQANASAIANWKGDGKSKNTTISKSAPILKFSYWKFRPFVVQRKTYVYRTYVRWICAVGIQNRR